MLAGFGVILALNTANAATGRSGVVSNQQRMPSMPTLPGNSIGNISPSIPNGNDKPIPGCIVGNPCICSNGATGVYKSDCSCNCTKIPEQECPDGGVKNSVYGVENCMNDVLACINNGALPGGLNDLFNEDLRNAIFNGMSLCYVQVERCVTEVRRDCRNVYNSSSDVWWDFNSRKIQPEYYSFILRKTGLTPNQAENTCLLLDRNTYGSSFNAVSGSNNVTAEYNNRVGAYNSQAGNALVKTNPQGVQVNKNGMVDANRGHYARWDAATGECLLRVGAYNKGSQIKNSWLFGAVGDDKLAEVWQPAGSSFSCNKNLFEFSLLKNTNTVAVVGIGGGTLVGAGVGAIAGHGKRDFDCTRKSHLEQLSEELRGSGQIGKLNKYLDKPISSTSIISEPACIKIVNLYDTYDLYRDPSHYTCGTVYQKVEEETAEALIRIEAEGLSEEEFARRKQEILDEVNRQLEAAGSQPTVLETVTVTSECKFTSLKVGAPTPCEDNLVTCLPSSDIAKEVRELDEIFASVKILKEGEKGNRVQSTLIGAGVGAGAGGLATLITSFVEKNDINCRVGDGLEKVSYGKSFSIGTLKDFYVKWNLQLPDTIMPTAQVTDCTSWKSACSTLKDLNQCVNAQINYRPAGANYTTLVNGACAISGSVCLENYPVAKSQGACQ